MPTAKPPALRHWISTDFVDASVFTGILVPTPDVVVSGLLLNGNGALTLRLPFPAGVPSGTALWFQYWIPDLGATFGVVASAGLRGRSP